MTLALVATAAPAQALTMTTPANGAAYSDGTSILYEGTGDPNFVAGIVFGTYVSADPPFVFFYLYPALGYTDVKVKVTRTSPPGFAELSFEGSEPTPLDPSWGPYAGGPIGGLEDGHYRASAFHIADGGPETVTNDFDIDSVEPDTVIDSTPSNPDNDPTPQFTFHAEDPAPSSGTSLECKINLGAWNTCLSGDTFPLSDGNHTFNVRAVDDAGNVDQTPATYSWLLDATPPNITLTTPPNGVHYLLNQAVTADYSCVDPLAGDPPAGPVSSGLATCAGPVPDGSPVDTSTLGPHLFTVNASDNAGNTTTVTRVYVVDPPRYPDLVGEDDPIAYYRLGDPVGSEPMIDDSGNGHHGTYKNGIALHRPPAISCEGRPHPPQACDFGGDPEDWAGYFPARDGYGYANGIAAPQGAYSLEAWVKPADSGDMMIAAHGGGGQLFITGGKLAFRQTQDTIVGSGGPTLTPGQWWHVAASWDAGVSRVYVNGVQVASSTTANKRPSGSATFYVGYGDQAPWFHGTLDEVVYYDRALDANKFAARYATGTATDHPSPPEAALDPSLDTTRPSSHPTSPADGGLYAPTKTPNAAFTCEDPDGPGDVASCTATVDGNPILNGAPLPNSPGAHAFVVTAVDDAGLTYVHTHPYTVANFASILGFDQPLAYFRLGDSGDTMADASPNGHTGTFKNGQESGPGGISGDGDLARRFFGSNGYGFVSGISAGRFQSTLEAWVNPDDPQRDQSIAGHGDASELYITGGLFAFRHMDQTVIASVGPQAGVWTQVVGTWDGVNIEIYVDSILRGSVEATPRPSSSSTFYVGFGQLAPWFDGAIDEVVYYDVALTQARIYQHFLADPPPDLETRAVARSEEQASTRGEESAPAPGAGDTQPLTVPRVSKPPLRAPATKPAKVTDPRLAACRKRKGAKKAICIKRARALIKCDAKKGATKKACVRKAKRKWAVLGSNQ